MECVSRILLERITAAFRLVSSKSALRQYPARLRHPASVLGACRLIGTLEARHFVLRYQVVDVDG